MRKHLAVLIVLAVLACSQTVLAAPKTMADGGHFDPEYYAANNPDVVAAFGSDELFLYQHYLVNGKAEGRLPYAPDIMSAPGPDNALAPSGSAKTMADGGLFDPVYYAKANPDVAAVFGTDENALYVHYLLAGRAEGRLPYADAPGAAPVKEEAAPAAAILPGYGPGESTLYLSSGAMSACYRLVRTDGSEAFRVFLAPGTEVAKSFPSGTYVLKTAQGTQWVSDAQAFGSAGFYGVSDPFTYEAGGGYRITVSYQASGTSGIASTTLGEFLR